MDRINLNYENLIPKAIELSNKLIHEVKIINNQVKIHQKKLEDDTLDAQQKHELSQFIKNERERGILLKIMVTQNSEHTPEQISRLALEGLMFLYTEIKKKDIFSFSLSGSLFELCDNSVLRELNQLNQANDPESLCIFADIFFQIIEIINNLDNPNFNRIEAIKSLLETAEDLPGKRTGSQSNLGEKIANFSIAVICANMILIPFFGVMPLFIASGLFVIFMLNLVREAYAKKQPSEFFVKLSIFSNEIQEKNNISLERKEIVNRDHYLPLAN